jgi:hypothetical protein
MKITKIQLLLVIVLLGVSVQACKTKKIPAKPVTPTAPAPVTQKAPPPAAPKEEPAPPAPKLC